MFLFVQSRGRVCYRPRTQTCDAWVYGPKPVWFYTRFLHYVRTHLHAASLVRSHWRDWRPCYVRAALLDYKKAFDLVDHNLLIAKLFSVGVKPTIVNWVVDFLRNRYQRVKVNSDSSRILKQSRPEFHREPGSTHGSFWLWLMTSQRATPSVWKFADDTMVSEIVPKFGASMLQNTVNDVLRWSNDNRFKLNSLKDVRAKIF